MPKPPPTLLFALACGLLVANVSFPQPLLGLIAADFAISTARSGGVVTMTQVGYAAGLLLIAPLGDLLDRRRLIAAMMGLSALGLILAALAQGIAPLLAAMAALGGLAVGIQLMVAYSAQLAEPAQRGRVVGIVTSGVVLGILAARSGAGGLADLVGWRSAYWTAAALNGLVAILLWRMTPGEVRAPAEACYLRLLLSVFRLFREEPALRLRAAFAALIFGAASILWSTLAMSLTTSPNALSHTQVGLFGLSGLAGAVAAVWAGRLADRGWANRAAGCAMLVLTLAWTLVVQAPQSLWAVAAGVVLIDAAVQIVHVTSQTALYALRPDARSRLVAAYMLFYSIGGGVGAIAATTAYANLGWGGVCALGAAFSWLALLLWSIAAGKARSG